jgi:hypothetical protein
MSRRCRWRSVGIIIERYAPRPEEQLVSAGFCLSRVRFEPISYGYHQRIRAPDPELTGICLAFVLARKPVMIEKSIRFASETIIGWRCLFECVDHKLRSTTDSQMTERFGLR